jgi:hypothetical protein
MEDSRKNSFAEEAVGVAPPRAFLALDASVLDRQETHEIIREDIKQNRIEYIFPDGLNKVDILEECRALNCLDDFDTMYDFTMQSLAGKPVTINLKNYDGSKTELATFQVVDRFMDLHGVEVIDRYPWLVNWMTEFIGAHISKKFPLPGQGRKPPSSAAGTGSGGPGKDRKKTKKFWAPEAAG